MTVAGMPAKARIFEEDVQNSWRCDKLLREENLDVFRDPKVQTIIVVDPRTQKDIADAQWGKGVLRVEDLDIDFKGLRRESSRKAVREECLPFFNRGHGRRRVVKLSSCCVGSEIDAKRINILQ